MFLSGRRQRQRCKAVAKFTAAEAASVAAASVAAVADADVGWDLACDVVSSMDKLIDANRDRIALPCQCCLPTNAICYDDVTDASGKGAGWKATLDC